MLTSQVFVSHTSDMAAFPVGRSFVQAALDGIGRTGLAAVDMRYFTARDGAPADYCCQRVRECEIYVALIGFRYGSLIPGTERSFTEAEFAEASAAGIPRLVFLLDEAVTMPEGTVDADRGAVERFRQRLGQAGLIVARFSTPADLELEVLHALTELLRSRSPVAYEAGIRYLLPPELAAEMLGLLVPRARAEPAPVAGTERRTGYLPLAISLLARVFNRTSPATGAGRRES
jgi:hypothetical protein